jgi:hypothetical protein
MTEKEGQIDFRKFAHSEYRPLANDDIAMYANMAGDELEKFYNGFQELEDADFVSTSYETGQRWDGTFTYATVDKIITLTEVLIEYAQDDQDEIAEQFSVKVTRSDEGGEQDFLNRYHVSCTQGGECRGYVEHTAFNTPLNEYKGLAYGRDMTAYDYDEMFKDLAEINLQIKHRLVQ